jgi:protein required for attachment to host cells
MLLAHGTIVAVADGEKLTLYRNGGSDTAPHLTAIGTPGLGDDDAIPSGGRHHSSAANPDDAQLVEDGHAAGVASLLNKMALDGEIDALVVVAPPKTLGELRKHWHKDLQAKLIGEINKDLAGRTPGEIAAAIGKA